MAPFAPVGRYEGHWGLDLAARYGSPVRAAGAGIVTFAGSVAGMRSVTIDHGGGLRSSVSYLSEILVETGMRVVAGDRGRAVRGGLMSEPAAAFLGADRW